MPPDRDAHRDGPGGKDQRLQISASTTTATTSNPTNRIMMVPIRCGSARSGIGSVVSGRMLFIKIYPPRTCRPLAAPALGRSTGPASSKGIWPNTVVSSFETWPEGRSGGHWRRGPASRPENALKTKPPRSLQEAAAVQCGRCGRISRCEGCLRCASTAPHCRRSCGWISSRPG